PQVFSVEAWFKTTSTSGGKIIGYGNNTTGDSSNYDRHVYMTNDGKLVFGVYNNGVYTVSSSAAYNDGAWHQVVGTLGAYGQAVWDANPDLYLRLDETSGTSALNTMTAEQGGTYNGVTLGQPGSPAAADGKSVTFPGGATTVVATQLTSNPQVFSLETWFK